MGDGSIGNKSKKNQLLKVAWSSQDQCDWLDESLGWLSTGVKLNQTAEELADKNKRSGFSPTAKKENYSDMYRIRTRSHPYITSLTSWYGESKYDKKTWPQNIHLSPTVLLLLYISDGYYSDKNGERRIEISLNNEKDNEKKFSSYFKQVGLPCHSNWIIYEGKECTARWTVSDSKELFSYMDKSPLMDNEVPDGFEYKFPTEHDGTGKSMQNVT